MPKWTQDTIRKKALEVQLSIAKLDPLQQTLKLVEELCEGITGVKYTIDIDERHRAYEPTRRKSNNRSSLLPRRKRKSHLVDQEAPPG